MLREQFLIEKRHINEISMITKCVQGLRFRVSDRMVLSFNFRYPGGNKPDPSHLSTKQPRNLIGTERENESLIILKISTALA